MPVPSYAASALQILMPSLGLLLIITGVVAYQNWPRHGAAVPRVRFGLAITTLFWSVILALAAAVGSLETLNSIAIGLMVPPVAGGMSAFLRALMVTKSRRGLSGEVAGYRRFSDVLLGLSVVLLCGLAAVIFTSGVALTSISPSALLALIPVGFATYARTLDSCLSNPAVGTTL
jgi:hypothetical protein